MKKNENETFNHYIDPKTDINKEISLSMILHFVTVSNSRNYCTVFNTKISPPKINLHEAVKDQKIGIIKRLLITKADVNEKNHGSTPLHFATLQNNNRIMKILLHNKADPNLKDEAADNYIYNNTALHYAAKNDNIESLKTLLKYKANINALNEIDEAAIHTAIQHDNSDSLIL